MLLGGVTSLKLQSVLWLRTKWVTSLEPAHLVQPLAMVWAEKEVLSNLAIKQGGRCEGSG